MRTIRWRVVGLMTLILTGCARHHELASANLADHCLVIGDYQLHFSRMDETLQQIAHGSGCFIELKNPKVWPLKAHPVIGRLSVMQAVQQAIQDQPLLLTHPKPDLLKLTIKKPT
ncbi:hypothetical protein [Celerinatantimonas yamalensis]|uniref:Lipoprotein n=1 Tax=Celerinatantimonas yamalensis TaxID=559956 RepID=A0ABW9GEV5_9GAMM